METKKTNYREGFYDCIRYAWQEINSPTDERTKRRVINLINNARNAYNKLKENNEVSEIMLNELNELEEKLNLGVIK